MQSNELLDAEAIIGLAAAYQTSFVDLSPLVAHFLNFFWVMLHACGQWNLDNVSRLIGAKLAEYLRSIGADHSYCSFSYPQNAPFPSKTEDSCCSLGVGKFRHVRALGYSTLCRCPASCQRNCPVAGRDGKVQYNYDGIHLFKKLGYPSVTIHIF